MKFFILIICSVFMLTACQHEPTKTTEQKPVIVESVQLNPVSTKKVQEFLKKQPVILDARSAFDFNLAHAPGAQNVIWSDFSVNQQAERGVLDSDLFLLARRVAVLGIDPSTPVLVLGKGHDGEGEEGRIAWMLSVLGVKKIMTAHFKELRSLNVAEAPDVLNKPIWKPRVQQDQLIDLQEFKIALKNDNLVVLDLTKTAEERSPDLWEKLTTRKRFVNLDWKSFYTPDSRVASDVAAQLATHKINKNDDILVISKDGLQSAAVVYALQESGFARATHFSGGYLLWKNKNSKK